MHLVEQSLCIQFITIAQLLTDCTRLVLGAAVNRERIIALLAILGALRAIGIGFEHPARRIVCDDQTKVAALDVCA